MVTVDFNLLMPKQAMQHYFVLTAKKMARSSNSYRKFRLQIRRLPYDRRYVLTENQA